MTGNTSLVGHCVSLLPVRTRLAPESSFHQYLAVVKKSVLDAYEHHQCTIGEILKYLNVPRHASRPPLAEVIFNVDRDPGSAEFFGVTFSCERNPKRALHFDLFLNFGREFSRVVRVERFKSKIVISTPEMTLPVESTAVPRIEPTPVAWPVTTIASSWK